MDHVLFGTTGSGKNGPLLHDDSASTKGNEHLSYSLAERIVTCFVSGLVRKRAI